jgi:hypothetical protein
LDDGGEEGVEGIFVDVIQGRDRARTRSGYVKFTLLGDRSAIAIHASHRNGNGSPPASRRGDGKHQQGNLTVRVGADRALPLIDLPTGQINFHDHVKRFSLVCSRDLDFDVEVSGCGIRRSHPNV